MIATSRCSSAIQVRRRAGRSSAGRAFRATARATLRSNSVAPICQRAIIDSIFWRQAAAALPFPVPGRRAPLAGQVRTLVQQRPAAVLG